MSDYEKERDRLRRAGYRVLTKAADARIAELQAALAERDRMLRLSAKETAPYDGFTGSTSEEMYEAWLADLRTRAKEAH